MREVPAANFGSRFLELAGKRTSERQIWLEGCGTRTFAGNNKVSGTGESTQLFLKLKVFMPEMKLNSTWVRDALMCIKQNKQKNQQQQHSDPWRQDK